MLLHIPWAYEQGQICIYEFMSTIRLGKKIFVWILMFLHISRAYEQGQICIYGFVSKICLGKKFLNFWLGNHARAVEKPKNNSFRVPIRVATNCFAFEKFPPPLPLLHPSMSLKARVYPTQLSLSATHYVQKLEWLIRHICINKIHILYNSIRHIYTVKIEQYICNH